MAQIDGTLLRKNDHAVPTCWPDQTKPQNQYFFIWSFVVAHFTYSNSEWGYRSFLWTKGTPKYISRTALVNISREQGNKPNFGGSEYGNLENSSIHFYALAVSIRYCPSAIAVFRCFINVQKDANEPKLIQAGCTMQFMPRICVMFCVRRSQQFCTLTVNGNADNQNLLTAVTH